MQSFKHFLHKNTIGKYQFSKGLKQTGISFAEYCQYRYPDLYEQKFASEANLLGRKIGRINTFSFVQNVEEIFVDEVYKFSSMSGKPFIIDCGANIGLSIIYFKRLFANAKIIAFEPDAGIFKICSDNIAAFGLKDVDIINAAVWTSDGTLNFLADNSLGGKVSSGEESSSELVEVKSVRLKKYLNQNQEIDFLKLDIEGAEDEVILDCKNDLGMVKNLFLEYHSDIRKPQSLPNILDALREAGFRYYIKEAWNVMNYPFIEHNQNNSSLYDMQLNIFAYRE